MAGKKALTMKAAILVLAAGLTLALCGCRFHPTLLIVNNSGVGLDLRGDDPGLVGQQEKITRIAPGASKKVEFFTVVQGDVLRLRAGGCDYLYEVPKTPWHDLWGSAPLPIQVEPDMAAHLKAPGRSANPPSELALFQQGGFPLRPKKICPAAGG